MQVDSLAKQTVAANVRAEAARRSISQSAAAKALGMNQAAISRRWTGKVDFSAMELSALAELFGIPVATFFGEVVLERAS